MLGAASLVLGLLLWVLFFAWLIDRFRGSTADADSWEASESWERHKAAQGREPPVDLGEEVRVAVEEFTSHHSGKLQALCRVEGFVIFVDDLPDDLGEGDVIRAEVRSFNRGYTSAKATFLEHD